MQARSQHDHIFCRYHPRTLYTWIGSFHYPYSQPDPYKTPVAFHTDPGSRVGCSPRTALRPSSAMFGTSGSAAPSLLPSLATGITPRCNPKPPTPTNFAGDRSKNSVVRSDPDPFYMTRLIFLLLQGDPCLEILALRGLSGVGIPTVPLGELPVIRKDFHVHQSTIIKQEKISYLILKRRLIYQFRPC